MTDNMIQPVRVCDNCLRSEIDMLLLHGPDAKLLVITYHTIDGLWLCEDCADEDRKCQ